MLFVDSDRNHGGLRRIRPEASSLNQDFEWVKRTIAIAELLEKRPHHGGIEERVHGRLGSGHGQSLCQKDGTRGVEIGNKCDDRIRSMRGPIRVILVDRQLSHLRVPVHDQ